MWKAGLILTFQFFFTCLIGQINVDFVTQDASCSGKGSITVNATGGKAPYAYEITDNTCNLNNRPLQTNNVFSGLTSCTYTVKVIDADGKIFSKQAIVGGNYIGPSASVQVDGCGFIINARNGNAPITYSLSNDGGKTYANATNQNMYTGLQRGTYFLKIEDACNSTYITSATIELDTLEYYFDRTHDKNFKIQDSIAPMNITGGKGPFQFFIVNGKDTLGSVNNHFAIKDIVKTCATQVVIKSACFIYVFPFTYADANISCIDIAAGKVELKVNIGVPPFSSFYYVSNSFTETPGLKINNLIKNDVYYSFSVKDGCNHFANSGGQLYYYRPELNFKTQPGCNDFTSTTLTISNENPFKTNFDVECTTCLPVQKFSAVKTSIVIPNLNTGKKTIVISDSCGTKWTCTSELIIPVEESCDSIKLHLINSFLCDNRTAGTSFSGDSIPADMYYLRTSAGAIIDSNKAGVFKNLINGSYIVQGRSGMCGLIQGTYVRNITIKAPSIKYGVGRNNNDCKTKYFINTDYAYIPYLLTDISGKIFNVLPGNATPQFGVYFIDLEPGTYILKSLKNCWQDTIRLPEIKSKIKIEDITVCPAGGSVTLSGGKNFKQWQAEYSAKGLDLYYINKLADWYDFSRSSKFNYDTARHTYFNIEPGKTYTVYLHSFASVNYTDLSNTCPLDSLTFTVPRYTAPTLIADLTLKCDLSNTTLTQFKILQGTKPYTIQEINCTNQSNIGNATTSMDSIVTVSNLSLSNHCFKLTDACQNTSNTEASIGNLDANIQSQKNCDSTTTFYFSNIFGATFNWTNKSNVVLGQASSITIPDPKAGDEIKLAINYKGCLINKSILITTANIQALKLNIHPQSIIKLCFNGTEKINPVITGGIRPFQYEWSTGTKDSSITINRSGTYILTVTSATGCVVRDSVKVIIGDQLVISPTVKHVACFGDSTGSIRALTTGGLLPYRYKWSDSTTLETISKKPAGSYNLIVTDDANCTIQRSILIDQNAKLTGMFNTSEASCDISRDGSAQIIIQGGQIPYSYAWNEGTTSNMISNINPGTYSVNVTDAAQCVQSFQLMINKKPVPVFNRVDTICANASLMIGNSKYSVSGNYRDTLKNKLGCDSLVLTRLVVNAPLQFNIASQNPSCNDQNNGQITITNINSRGPYQFSVNNVPYQGLSTNTLLSGNYVVKITDGYQCFLEKGISLANPPKLLLDAGKDTTLQFGDSLSISISTNVLQADIKKITWTGSPVYNCIGCGVKAVLKPKLNTNFKVEIETQSGCKVTDQFLVKVNSDFRVFSPNVMLLNTSGNSPLKNSMFTLYGGKNIESIEYLRIFNRQGALIFEAKNIPADDPQFGWDGTYRGHKVDPDVYVYVARVVFPDHSVKIIHGDVTIVD